jgi:hypothetical protein
MSGSREDLRKNSNGNLKQAGAVAGKFHGAFFIHKTSNIHDIALHQTLSVFNSDYFYGYLFVVFSPACNSADTPVSRNG